MNDWSRLKQTEAADTAPVSLAEMKSHLGISGSTQDTALQATLNAAVALIEGPHGIGICISTQSWQLSLDYFPCEIRIPLGPVSDVLGITYTDADGDPKTVASWLADLDAEPARIRPARGESWPTAAREPGSVKVEFTAGYEDVPANLKYAVMLVCQSLWRVGRESAILRKEIVEGIGTTEYATAEIAEAVFDKTVARLLEPYRVGRFA